jgi:hypothetical protein
VDKKSTKKGTHGRTLPTTNQQPTNNQPLHFILRFN